MKYFNFKQRYIIEILILYILSTPVKYLSSKVAFLFLIVVNYLNFVMIIRIYISMGFFEYYNKINLYSKILLYIL